MGNLVRPFRLLMLRHYLPSGDRRDKECWSIKEKKRAGLFMRLVRRQLQLAAAASPAAAAAEEDVAHDMVKMLLCMTRVKVVSDVSVLSGAAPTPHTAVHMRARVVFCSRSPPSPSPHPRHCQP